MSAQASSDNLLEMAMEQNPAKWAAYQIAAKSRPEIKTIGQAMEMMEGIIQQAIEMDRFNQMKDKQP